LTQWNLSKLVANCDEYGLFSCRDVLQVRVSRRKRWVKKVRAVPQNIGFDYYSKGPAILEV
jgi:hypothetical protein